MSAIISSFWHYNVSFITKIFLCVAVGFIFLIIGYFCSLSLLINILLAWNGFALTLGILYWVSFIKTPTSLIQKQAVVEDFRRSKIVAIILLLIIVSFIAILLLMNANNLDDRQKLISTWLSLTTISFSWGLLHTIYTVKYAHEYYKNTTTQGLVFPGDLKEPNFMDFAYFSFVLGMTFQVSDVNIASSKIRRMALWHGLLSFGFNAVIIAFSINAIAGLGK